MPHWPNLRPAVLASTARLGRPAASGPASRHRSRSISRAGAEPAQVRRLRRGHPVDIMAAAGEEHRDRQPRRPGRLEHHREPAAHRRFRSSRVKSRGPPLDPQDAGSGVTAAQAVPFVRPECSPTWVRSSGGVACGPQVVPGKRAGSTWLTCECKQAGLGLMITQASGLFRASTASVPSLAMSLYLITGMTWSPARPCSAASCSLIRCGPTTKPPRFTRPWRCGSRWRNWQTRSGSHPGADLCPYLAGPSEANGQA